MDINLGITQLQFREGSMRVTYTATQAMVVAAMAEANRLGLVIDEGDMFKLLQAGLNAYSGPHRAFPSNA